MSATFTDIISRHKNYSTINAIVIVLWILDLVGIKEIKPLHSFLYYCYKSATNLLLPLFSELDLDLDLNVIV